MVGQKALLSAVTSSPANASPFAESNATSCSIVDIIKSPLHMKCGELFSSRENDGQDDHGKAWNQSVCTVIIRPIQVPYHRREENLWLSARHEADEA